MDYTRRRDEAYSSRPTQGAAMLKRIAVIAAAVLCTSAPAGAQVESYPPDTSSLRLNAPPATPGPSRARSSESSRARP